MTTHSVIIIHWLCVPVVHVRTRTRYPARANHIKPSLDWIVNSMLCCLLYEIECHARAKQVKGHSNRSKDISLGRLHYHVSTNLALLQANLTYMHAKFGISYHWIPDLYRRMKLPVFDGVQEALEKQRKRKLEREKTTPVKG